MICRRSVLAFTAALMLASAAHAQQPVLRAAPLRPKLAVQPAIVPAAEQRLLAAQRRLSPPAKTFLAREAARLAAAGPVTEAQARAAVTQPDDIKAKMDAQSEMAEMDQLRLQTVMERRAKALEMLSNLMKKSSDTQSTIIQNLK